MPHHSPNDGFGMRWRCCQSNANFALSRGEFTFGAMTLAGIGFKTPPVAATCPRSAVRLHFPFTLSLRHVEETDIVFVYGVAADNCRPSNT